MNGTVSIAWVLARRELRARYRESILGLSWLLILPLLMASLYTLVFWGVFQARWPAAAEIAAPGGAQQGPAGEPDRGQAGGCTPSSTEVADSRSRRRSPSSS